MQIAVIGTGYVGLVAGACFADSGNDVICVDKDASKVERLKKGEIPIYEPGLDEVVKKGVAADRLTFTTSTEEAVKKSDIIFVAVGTPALPSGEPNLTFLKAAAEEIGRAMNGHKIIVNKSTVPVGAHKWVREWIVAHTKHSVEVVSNPEFLKEGTAVDDFFRPDRVVIGTTDPATAEKMVELYSPFVRQGNPILTMDPVSAELTKYASNSFLATRISFMNELSVLCEKVGGDIELIRKGMATDQRIGRHFLYAGAGYGGSCFPKDIEALLSTAQGASVPMRLIQAAQEANAAQKHLLAKKVKQRFGENLDRFQFAVWGLAFKPNTDDIREAPALVLIDELLKAGAKIKAYDPVAMDNVKEVYGSKVRFTTHAIDALSGSDALIVVTEWNEFRQADFAKIKETLNTPVIFDGRNIYDPKAMKKMGFTYTGIGRALG